jgi:hypothetical protein
MIFERFQACRNVVAWVVAGPLAVTALAAGCSRSLPPVARVSGRVTLAGKPVSTGMVMFHPEHGRAALGQIDNDGRYTLTTFHKGDGAVLGPHRVTIEARTVEGGPPPPKVMSTEEEMKNAATLYPSDSRIRWIVPEKYASAATTPLSADVKPSGNIFDFSLP